MMTATPSKCPPNNELRDYALGRLADDASDGVFEHVRDCDVCSAELETIDDGEDSVIGNLRAADPLARFADEPACQFAVAKALGALAGEAAADAFDHDLPRQIGEYEIVRPLGRGGMGSVYLARHSKLQREVALKILVAHRLADPRMRQRFEAEMRAVGRLSHPNIVTAHDAREVEGTAVLVTEYIDGIDLGKLVQTLGPLRIADACQIVRMVAIALTYCNAQGFVHRDIKPSNIMLSRSGEVKLLDLGLARLQYGERDQVGMTGAEMQQPEIKEAEITATGQTMGTADYIAPEQVIDSRSVDVRADIYSLGCTLMKLLTGQTPFANANFPTPFAKLTAHVSTPAPRLKERLPDAPKALATLVDSMLEKEPSRRPQSPLEIAERLLPFTDGSDLSQLGQTQFAPSLDSQSQHPAMPLTEPARYRGVPTWVAVGAGFLGLAIGLFLGVLITIKYPDGTTAQIAVPAGSKITLHQSDDPPAAFGAGAVSPMPVDSELASMSVVSDGKNVVDLQGIWNRIVPKNDSDKANDGNNNELIIFDQGRYLRYTAPQTIAEIGIFSLDHNKNPAQIDIRLLYPEQRTLHGIYGFFDQQVVVRLADAGRRPERLTAVRAVDLENVQNSTQQYQLKYVGAIPEAPEDLAEVTDRVDTRWHPLLEEIKHLRHVSAEELSKALVDSLALTESLKALKAIGLAFYNFHDVYRKFPGSQNVREGKQGINGDAPYPFSWRVAILPFVKHQALFEQYRFDEPWDSEHNLTLIEKMPSVYRNPFAATDQPLGETNYLGFATADGGLGITGHSLAEFTDGTSSTALIVATKKSVPWTKPEDLGDGEFEASNGRLIVLKADASVEGTFPIDHERFQKMITRAGGERID